MGSPLSLIVANLVLQKFKFQTISKLFIKFLLRWYYDLLRSPFLFLFFLALTIFLTCSISFYPRLRFTMEVGGDELNFLDIILLKRDSRLYSNWFRKPTFSGRFLNFYSQHLFAHKKGTILSLIDRVIFLSHSEFYKENFDFVIKILSDNGYPLDLIFSTIRRRLHSRINYMHRNLKEPEQSFIFYYSLRFLHR